MLSSFHWCYDVFILKVKDDGVNNRDYDDESTLALFQVGNISDNF